MEQFFQYHNVDTIGYGCEGLTEPRVFTNRQPPRDTVGSLVHLIVGEKSGRRKRFVLRLSFEADRIEAGDADFRFHVVGGPHSLVLHDPPVDLTDEPWFDDFKHVNGNFAFGLRRIGPEYLDYFSRLRGR